MEFTNKKLSELIRRLLAPSWQERQAADNIMMMILLGQKKDSKGRWIEELTNPFYGLKGNDIILAAKIVESLGPSAVSLKKPLEKLIKNCISPEKDGLDPWKKLQEVVKKL